MVHKPSRLAGESLLLFENDVKMYGTQASASLCHCMRMFENDVKMYGTQAEKENGNQVGLFENDVKMYGTQARNLVIINQL